jgi:nicotinamide-nucleotide amidase
VKVRLTASARTRADAEALIRPVAGEVAERLGDVVFTTADEELEQVVGRALRARRQRVACAESLTGGGLARRLTTAPGASDYFVGSAVCYSEDAKVSVLGSVPRDARRAGCRERGVRAGDGGRRASDLPGRRDGRRDRRGGAGAPRRKTAGNRVDRARHGRRHARRLLHAPGDREQVERWTEQAALDLLRRSLSDLPLE